MSKRDFLGKGWKFPLQVNANGGVAMSRYEQSIEESIYIILGTAKGERLMMPEFGCGIHDIVFSPNNPAVVTMIVDATRKALVTGEPRIDVLGIDAQTSIEEPNVLIIRINYRVRSNNTVENIVYPFYITEGN
jgi:phage baseplate assembly protein W